MIDQKTTNLLIKLSDFLNNNPCLINYQNIKPINKILNDSKKAYIYLLKSYLNLNEDFDFDTMINKLNKEIFEKDQYYQKIKFTKKKYRNWEIKYNKYVPYECFVCDDFKETPQGIIPILGFFETPFTYPAIYQNNHLWMSVTPNEINTMKEDINNAKGNVLTIGLGLGYYAYHVSLKNDVKKVYIIEKDQEVIKLFNDLILPQFEQKEKIIIINDDAFNFLTKSENQKLLKSLDYIYIDIWHDVSDGLQIYHKLKQIETSSNLKFHYWIEKTIKYYL